MVEASSESLTHAACYECSSKIKAVIHVHNFAMWENLIDNLPTTNENITYGTPEMALEIKRLFKEYKLDNNIMVMGGHMEGIISFGEDLDKAGRMILENIDK